MVYELFWSQPDFVVILVAPMACGVWVDTETVKANLLFSLLSICVCWDFSRFIISPQFLTGGWVPQNWACWAFSLFPLRFFVSGFDDIPHSFSPAGPRGHCTDAQDAPYSQFGPTWTVPLTNTYTYTLTHTRRFSKHPVDLIFFSISTVYSLTKKKCII